MARIFVACAWCGNAIKAEVTTHRTFVIDQKHLPRSISCVHSEKEAL